MRAVGRGEVVLLLRKRRRDDVELGAYEVDRRAVHEDAVLRIAADDGGLEKERVSGQS